MATLYVMVGLPGSGKSYWAKSFNCPIVSSDTIRKELSGSEDDHMFKFSKDDSGAYIYI